MGQSLLQRVVTLSDQRESKACPELAERDLRLFFARISAILTQRANVTNLDSQTQPSGGQDSPPQSSPSRRSRKSLART